MSVIWPLGDAIPPTAIIGRLTASTVGLEEPYRKFLRACLVPAVLIAVAGTLMVVFSKKLAFLAVF
jgi:CitMHS family citrate-Mg2+:H+ or citrate-Ca2+:H+ symporter